MRSFSRRELMNTFSGGNPLIFAVAKANTRPSVSIAKMVVSRVSQRIARAIL